MVFHGRYRNGVIVFDQDVKLPQDQPVRVEVEETSTAPAGNSVWQDLLELAGSCPDLPPDMSENHDHYIHGTPRREKKV